MIYRSQEIEQSVALETAKRMCVAARTAPKTKGMDLIHTMIITGDDLNPVSEEAVRLSKEFDLDFFERDSINLSHSEALVLIGASYGPRGLNESCGYCGFTNCNACTKADGICVYSPVDLGIAVGSAVNTAALDHVDNRVMFSLGRAALSLGLMDDSVKMILGIPLSVTGKSLYYDRKKKS